ncbi:MAG: D-alanine-D-alanine ligase [Planctomycetota bacterium]|jgi:D-alanine-D-alanine ligase
MADTTTRAETSTQASVPVDTSQAVVCVLGGGRSGEREISLLTQAAVIDALGSPLLQQRPRKVRPMEVLPDGRWEVDGQALLPGAALEALAEVDVFFLALHGGEGEDGTLQGLFDANERAYTGSGVTASAVAMDKSFARILATDAGLLVPPGLTVNRAQWSEDPGGLRERIASLATSTEDGASWFVKPRSGGSSVATTWIRNRDALGADLGVALAAVFAEGDEALVELGIEGIEVSVGVITEPAVGRGIGQERVLLPIEIQPHAEHFFDYDEKYTAGGAIEVCPPSSLGEATIQELQDLSLRAHHTLRCCGHTRTDFMVPTSGSDRRPVFLETNTLPGLTERSLLPQEAAAEGIDYPTLCLWMVIDGLARGARRANGVYA